MPAYQVTGPDGKKYRVNVPEGASSQDAIAYVYDTYYSRGAAPKEPEPERTIGGYAKEAVKGLIPGLVGLGETAITGAAALLPEGAEEAVRKPVEEFAAGVRETFAPAAGYEDTLVRKISEGVGSTLPFLPLGALGLAGRVAATGLGVSAGAGEARQRAEEAGATEGERGAATALGTIPGALEALPPVRILRRFGFGDEAIKEVAGVAPALGRIAKAGGEEALQEASSQVLQNLIAKGVYQPDEAVFGGVGEAATLGGGAGAVVSAIAELALGRRLRGPEGEPTPEEAPPEEELPTTEALAPKPGREARPSPVKAKTLEELTGLIPAAPKAEEEKVAAPAREPMVFERTKEPTPEAVQEAAAFVEKFPAGSKGFDVFKARSIAKKLGYEGIPAKGVGRVDLEPLIRSAVQPAAVEPVAPIAPPIEAGEEITVPETAQLDVLAGKDIRSPTDDIYEVAEANFNYPRMIGNQTVPIEQLEGGVTAQAGERKRVDELANQIASDEGYFSRIIVDQNNNVIEGQHRLEALRQLGAKEVPVFKIEDMGDTFPVMKMEAAVLKAQPMREEQASQIVKRALNAVAETGSVQEAAKLQIPGFQKGYSAALNVIEPVAPTVEVPSEPTRAGVSEVDLGAGARGVELPVSRVGTAGPEVAGLAPAGLERVGAAIERPIPRAETPAPALKKIEYKAEGPHYEQGLTFHYNGLNFELFASSGMFSQPMLAVYKSKTGDRVGDHYANNEKGQVDYRVGDANQIDKYDLPPSILTAIKDYLSSAGRAVAGTVPDLKPVTTAGKRVADAVNAEMVKYEAPPAPTTRIFESIEGLNRPLPPVTEQLGRDRAPSLRRELGKAVKQFDANEMSGAELANRASMLLLQTQKDRVVQPRQRGAEFIRERLFNASRNGYLDPQGVELASWFVQQNPVLVEDLGVSIRQQPEAMEGAAAFYNPANRIITLFKDKGDEKTATHEILHHTERLMPAEIRAGILKAYVKQLTKAIKSSKSTDEKAALQALLDHHLNQSNPAAYESVIKGMKSGKINANNYQFVNPSEFWAVNGSRIVQGRYDVSPGVVGQIRKWLREFIQKAKDVFGLKSDAAIIRALDSLAKADGKYQTEQLLAEAPAYQQIEAPKAGKPKKAKPEKPKKSMAELRREATDKMVEPGIVRKVINSIVNPQINYETVVKNFQNVSRKVKKIQQDLRTAGRLVYVGDEKNNIDDQISAAANRGSYIVATEVEPVAKRLRESIASYANATKTTIKDALEKLDGYFIALHEAERRETKYLRNVPLNNVTKIDILPGEPPMTPADARAALEERRSLAESKEQAEAIQDVIRYLVANYADPRGYSPVKAKLEKAGKPTPEEMTTDFYDDIYNVIGPEYTQDDLEATREEYENLDEETRALVDQVKADVAAVHELNKNLNRRANYWTDKVDRVIESYGWQNYVPFKGSAKADKTLDTDTEYLSGELSQTPESFEGRRSNFDSPILQTIAESYFAASRAGRGTDVTQTIKNLVKLGVIKTKNKKPKVFTFEERNAPDFDYNEVRGRDKILHYNDDGSVEVFSVENPEILEAIKTPYREMNWAVKAGNAITSGLGQLHTRFNPAFPPMDFIRNTITNAGLISAREGGKQAREYLTAVAANVARIGFWKSGELSYQLSKNNTAELERLAKESPFYRDALEMMKYGGRTMYRLSFDLADAMQELKEKVGPKKIIDDPALFMRLIDAYNDAFELTSRVGAYTVRKEQNIAEAKKQGLNVNDRKVMEDINKEAAAFALSLMDFRKIGKYGREMGAWFMFIRPAATGAVDAIDALRPGFFLKPEKAVEKAFARLEPEVQELFETQGLAQEIERIKGNKRPDKKKIAALEQEIANREKAFDEFETKQLTRAKNARNTALFTLAAGAALYGLASAVAGDDDEGRNRVTTDDMSRWTRYLRLPVIGDDGFFQIPWGFGVSALMSAGAQTAAVARGASSFKDYAGNMVEIGMDSFLPIPASRINPFENFGAWLIDSATPSAARPVVEFVLNVDAMGNPIYNSRAGKYADAFSGSTRPSEMHRKITETIFNATDGEVSISPDTVAFVLNNYADAPNHLADNSYNLFLTATGDKEFDAKKDTMFLRSFIGRNSNYDARKFAEAEKGIKELAQQLKTFEDLGTPEQVLRFYRKNPNADILVDIYNKGVNGELRKLQSERKELMLDRTLTPKQRDRYVEDIRTQENYIKKLLVEDFEAYKGS